MKIGPISLISCLLASVLSEGNANAQQTRLKTSYSALTANMAAYWLAKEAKIFEKHGLSVDVVLIESGVTTPSATRARGMPSPSSSSTARSCARSKRAALSPNLIRNSRRPGI
jgi:hypothetical protein